MPRPNVPTTRSFIFRWMHRSFTWIVGSPLLRRCHFLPPSSVKNRPNSVPHEEQVRIDVILGEAVDRAARRQVAGDARPRLARVGALQQVRREVGVLVVVEAGIDGVRRRAARRRAC